MPERITCNHCSADTVSYSDQRRGGPTYLCQECYDERWTVCEDCGEEIGRENASRGSHEESVCDDCYSNNYFCCWGCAETFSQDNRHEHSGRWYCGDCCPSNEDHISAKQFRPPSLTFTEIRSERRFGVELETHRCKGFESLDGRTHFSSREDGSIEGEEFVSVILQGDQGLDSIREFCRKARDFEVNAECGYHLHLDAWDLSPDQRTTVCIAYKLTERVWQSFVPESRRRGEFCVPIEWTVTRVKLANMPPLAMNASPQAYFAEWCQAQNRYQWFNVNAFDKHGTFEIRLHSATLNAEKVCNWVKAHARFMDAAAKMSEEEVMATFGGLEGEEHLLFQAVSQCWDDATLTEFYVSRAKEFGTEFYSEPVHGLVIAEVPPSQREQQVA